VQEKAQQCLVPKWELSLCPLQNEMKKRKFLKDYMPRAKNVLCLRSAFFPIKKQYSENSLNKH